MGGRVKREGTYVHPWLIHVEVWQKTAKFCKAIITQLINQQNFKDGHSARKTQRKEWLIQAGLGMQIVQEGDKDRIILYPRTSRMWKMEAFQSMLRDRNEEKPRWHHQNKKAEQNGVPQSSCTDSSFQRTHPDQQFSHQDLFILGDN